MKKFYDYVFWCLILLLTGCFPNDFQESVSQITTDCDRIIVEADSPDGITALLTVRANESWGLNVVDEAGGRPEWVNVSSYDHANLSGMTDETTVNIVVEPNRINRMRTALLKITSANCEKQVKIEQGAAVYYLRIDGPTTSRVDCGDTTVTISVLCNTRWSAAIADGTTASVTLNADSGDGNGDLSVSFAANEDIHNEKTAKVVLSAEDCADIYVVYTQSKNMPYLAINREQTVTSFGPEDTSACLYFSTNADWTASVSGAPTIGSFVLTKSEGSKADKYIDITFSESLTPEEKTATVVLTAEECEPQEITFTQRGMTLDLSFASQPFTNNIPTDRNGTVMATEYTFMQAGNAYVFELGSDDIFYYATGYICLTKGYVKTPAVTGLRLTKVLVTTGATNKWVVISTDNAGQHAVKGGERKTLAAPDDIGEWTLTDTETGTGYYIYLGSSSGRIKNIKLIYE